MSWLMIGFKLDCLGCLKRVWGGIKLFNGMENFSCLGGLILVFFIFWVDFFDGDEIEFIIDIWEVVIILAVEGDVDFFIGIFVFFFLVFGFLFIEIEMVFLEFE